MKSSVLLTVGIAVVGAALLSPILRAQKPQATPSPTPTPRAFTDDDLKRYHPSPSPTESAPAPDAPRASSGEPRSAGEPPRPATKPKARPYRRQLIKDPEQPKEEPRVSPTPPPRRDEVNQPPLNPTPPPTTAPPPPGEQRPPSAPLEDIGQKRAQWQQRADALRQALWNAQALMQRTDAELSDVANKRMMSTDTNEILRLSAELQAAQQRVDAARQQASAAEQALAALEEEARRSQIPPGWLREREPR